MATLVSPGVSVSVSDESFYAAAGAGTVPLIVIATAQDKKAPDGSTTAATQQPLTQENYIKLQAKENCSKVMVIQCLKRVVQLLYTVTKETNLV